MEELPKVYFKSMPDTVPAVGWESYVKQVARLCAFKSSSSARRSYLKKNYRRARADLSGSISEACSQLHGRWPSGTTTRRYPNRPDASPRARRYASIQLLLRASALRIQTTEPLDAKVIPPTPSHRLTPLLFGTHLSRTPAAACVWPWAYRRLWCAQVPRAGRSDGA
eukprot:8094538-Pyramimonas_sp.AAC.1